MENLALYRKYRPQSFAEIIGQDHIVQTLTNSILRKNISHAYLFSGPRGSGKTSLLGSLLLEILQKYRIITIEDTQELAIEDYKKLGYDILPLKVRSALMDSGMEMPFDKGLRKALKNFFRNTTVRNFLCSKALRISSFSFSPGSPGASQTS